MASLSMDGDDSQLVESILREMNGSNMGSIPQAQPQVQSGPMYDQNTLNMIQMNQQQASPMTHQIDPQLYGGNSTGQTEQRKQVDVSYQNNSAINWGLLWQRIKYPFIVFVLCMVVFNPSLYKFLVRISPSIFVAPDLSKQYIRTTILSLVVSILYGIVLLFV
jgi:hypothetical protein